MENWLERVRSILARNPTGVLPYSEILEALYEEARGPTPDPAWLLDALAARVDLFRVIPLARGPWAEWRRAALPRGQRYGNHADSRDPWILLLRPAETCQGQEDWVSGRVREGLVAWGRALDDGSPASVARWLRATREGARVWKWFRGLERPVT
jgi:hypothetical protein